MAAFPAPVRRRRPAQGHGHRRERHTIVDIQPCGDGFVFAAATRRSASSRAQGVANDPSRPAHRRHARQARVGVRGFARRRLGALRARRRGRKARRLRSRRRVTHGFAAPFRRTSRRRKVDGLPVTDWQDRLRAEVQGARNSCSTSTKAPARWRSGRTPPASRSEPTGACAPTTPRASSAGGAPARASPGASISPPTARSSPSPMRRHDPLAALERRGGDCSRCSSSRRAANGSPGRRPAITWPRPAARI